VITGYEMSQTVTVYLRRLGLLDPFIAMLVANDIDTFSGPHYRSSRQEALEEEATRLALLDARERAVRMAAVLDQRVGEPLKIAQEGVSAAPMPVMMEMRAAGAAEGPVTSPGEIVVRVGVSVTFRLLEGRAG
jgi:uncharacterized protein YggE